MKKDERKAELRLSIPKGAKILTSVWTMKEKANGTKRGARLNARGYEQIDGVHYDKNTKAVPVANGIMILIVLVIIAMAGWYAELLDVRGAFLYGRLEDGERIYMEVLEGFEK